MPLGHCIYRVMIHSPDKQVHLGDFENIESAFLACKTYARSNHMSLGPGVRYLSDAIKDEAKAVDEAFWEAKTPEDFLVASRRESFLEYLEGLYNEGEEYYVDF